MTSYKAPQDGALLETLFSLFPQQSRTSVKNMLSKGQVQVNGDLTAKEAAGANVGETLEKLLGVCLGFAGKVKIVSGDFSSDLALSKAGNTWSCGDGSAKLEIGTTSGNVKLAELK